MVEGSDADEYNRSPRGPSSIQVRPDQIRRLLDAGVAEDEIVSLLVATGTWTSSGAHEIVEFLSGQLVGAAQNVTAIADDSDWPGPIEEPSPIFVQ